MQEVVGVVGMEWQAITQIQIAEIIGISRQWLSNNCRRYGIYKTAQFFGVGSNTLLLWIDRFGYQYAAEKLKTSVSELRYLIKEFRAKKIVELLEIRGYYIRYEIVSKNAKFYYLGEGGDAV